MSVNQNRAKKKSLKGEGLIRQPEQARSRETMDNILKAMEALLGEKSFDSITVQEIAQRADTGVSSIYARFRDKQTLVLGLHLQLREEAIKCLQQLTNPDRWSDSSTEEIVSAIVPACVKFYRKHAAMLRASLQIDLLELRERQLTMLDFASKRLVAIFAPRYPSRIKEVEFAVQGSVTMVASIMYTSFLFNKLDAPKNRFANDRANIRLLIQSITMLINLPPE